MPIKTTKATEAALIVLFVLALSFGEGWERCYFTPIISTSKIRSDLAGSGPRC